MSPSPDADDDPPDGLLAEVAEVLRRPPPLAPPERVAAFLARLDAEPPDPLVFDQYHVVRDEAAREIGRGGMGVVYLAHDTALDRPVAIKVIHPHLAKDAKFRNLFRVEAQAVARIHSEGGVGKDHVVQVLTARTAGERLYLAMELLRGATLEEWLRCRPLPAPASDLWWVAEQVLTGLSAVHGAGGVHRDVKPQNLWVERESGRVKVLDFGIHLPAVAGRPGGAGTPAYMAPEQKRQEEIDARADLYALGAVLHRMVAGPPPDSGTLPADAALGTLPAELVTFIRRLLAEERGDRFPSAAAALDELRAVQVRAAGAETDRRADRRQWQLLTVGLAASLGIALAGWALDRSAGAQRAADREAFDARHAEDLRSISADLQEIGQKADAALKHLDKTFQALRDAKAIDVVGEQEHGARVKAKTEYEEAAKRYEDTRSETERLKGRREALLKRMAGGR